MLKRHRSEEGTTLVEMMVAILVIGIVLAALAQTLIGSLRATREAQDTQVVTAASIEVLESMQALPWADAAVYAGEVDAASSRYRDRLDAAGTFEGAELVELVGNAPLPPGDPNRDIPAPETPLLRDGITYTFDLYPLWVDRSDPADGVVDTKQFVVVASWDDPLRGYQELRTEAERAPTQAEAGSNTVGARFVFSDVSPSPITTESDGTTTEVITVRARSSAALTAFVDATFTWNEPTAAADGTITYTEVSETVQLTGTVAGDGGWVAFDGTFNARVGNAASGRQYRFPDGPVVIELSGTPTGGGGAVTGQTSLMVSSPFPAGTPTGGPSPAPSPTPTPSPTTPAPVYAGDPAITGITVPNRFCVTNKRTDLKSAAKINVGVKNVEPGSSTTAADGIVTVAYTYWNAVTPTGSTDVTYVADKKSISATVQPGGSSGASQWVATVPSGSVHFPENNTIVIDVKLTRVSDGKSVTSTQTTQVGGPSTC